MKCRHCTRGDLHQSSLPIYREMIYRGNRYTVELREVPHEECVSCGTLKNTPQLDLLFKEELACLAGDRGVPPFSVKGWFRGTFSRQANERVPWWGGLWYRDWNDVWFVPIPLNLIVRPVTLMCFRLSLAFDDSKWERAWNERRVQSRPSSGATDRTAVDSAPARMWEGLTARLAKSRRTRFKFWRRKA